MSRKPSLSAREQILNVAGDLFFRQGYHAVGVDTIVEQSGIAKMTLYRHFPSKDDLIAAYLEDANALFWRYFDEATAHANSPREKMIAAFEWVEHMTGTPACHGCAFQMSAAEFPNMNHPAHQVALQHKEAVRQRFHELAQAAGAHDPAALADQLLLLMDGAWAAKRMFGLPNPASHVASAAAALIDAQLDGATPATAARAMRRRLSPSS
jgi:AcrR family transcriptional regulator